MSSCAIIKREHNGRCTRKRMEASHSWLIQAAMTSLFHKRCFFLFPRDYVFKPKAGPLSGLSCAQTRILDCALINRSEALEFPLNSGRLSTVPHDGRTASLRGFLVGLTGRIENAVAPLITFCSAVRNFSISSCVPTVMRGQVGMMGQTRPMKTFCCAMASITSLPGRLLSSRKQFDSEGV